MLWASVIVFVAVVFLTSRRKRPENIICVRDELDDHTQDLAYPHEFASLMGRIRKESEGVQ